MSVSLNMLDIDDLISSFMQNKKRGIQTLYKIFFKKSDALALAAFEEEVKDELRTGCVSFVNKYSSLDGLDNYLFYIVNAFCKKQVKQQVKKITEYLCPGCLFFGEENIIYYNKLFKCSKCSAEMNDASEDKYINFYKCFFIHNKFGYRCNDCKRFIPKPLDNSNHIICPYLDCCFIGNVSSLKKMNHPTSKSNPEKLILDSSKDGSLSLKDNIIHVNFSPLDNLIEKQDLTNKINILNEVIEEQINKIPYSGSSFTMKHKECAYLAYKNLILEHPEDMIKYMLDGSRTGGFQSKAFQKYVEFIENSIPFIVTKKSIQYKISNLLDPNLGIFDGISKFTNIVSETLVVKNNTKEFYIGGRKASYAEPYYIGKILSIIDVKTKKSLMDNIETYSFSKIKMKDISPGTEVEVVHLRIPPHYEMGGMTHINRVKSKIVKRAKILLENSENNAI